MDIQALALQAGFDPDEECSLRLFARLVLEEAAKVVEERGRIVCGAIDPRITAKAIRDLKP